MTCPMCEGKTTVVYTLPDADSVIRKRKCLECGYMFFTSEVEDAAAQGIYIALVRNKKANKKGATRK